MHIKLDIATPTTMTKKINPSIDDDYEVDENAPLTSSIPNSPTHTKLDIVTPARMKQKINPSLEDDYEVDENAPLTSPISHSPTHIKLDIASPAKMTHKINPSLEDDYEVDENAPLTSSISHSIPQSENGNVEPPKKGLKKEKRITKNSVYINQKVEALSWLNFFALTIVCAIPSALYVLLFTEIGFGLKIFYNLALHFQKYASSVLIGVITLFVALYLLDFSYWKGPLGICARYFSWVFMIFTIFIWVLLMTAEIPYGPISLSAMLIPLWLVIVKWLCFRNRETKVVISWLSGPLFLVALITCLLWIAWTWLSDANEWNALNQAIGADGSGCEPDFEMNPECAILVDDKKQVCFNITNENVTYPEGNDSCTPECLAVYSSCLNTFILWVGPLLMATVMLFLSFFCSFLKAGSTEKEMMNFGKLWLLLLGTMWISASLVGAGEGMTSALAGFTLASFVGSTTLLAVSYTKEEDTELISSFVANMTEKYGSFIDIVRGLLVIVAGPVSILALAISAINQGVRKIGMPCSKKFKSDAERNDWVTKKMRCRLDDYQSWDRTKVFTYAQYWGMGLMIVNVLVGKFITLLLAWLIDATSDLDIFVATIILFGVGVIMFLLPPVPGVPIYLTLGIVIVPIGEPLFGLVGAMAYACAVSLFLKLFAVAVQQKCIGEALSNSVSVRRMVGINSHLIRTMKLILMDPKLSVAKIAILVGGPDWPVSVLCGIMRLGLVQNLIGTLPVFLVVLPTVLAGSFTYMGSNDPDLYPWANTASTMCTAFTGGIMLYFMSLAAFHVENVASTRSDELAQMPFDAEVLALEEEEAVKNEKYSQATQWTLVPFFPKLLLSSSVVIMTGSIYTVQLFMDKCFAEFGLTSSIEDDLDGNALNFVLPLGWFAMGLFSLSIILFQIFVTWATMRTIALSKLVEISSLESQPVFTKEPEE